jgi:hypothetical protein
MRPELMEAILRLTDGDDPVFCNVQIKDGVLSATDGKSLVQVSCETDDGIYSAKDFALESVIAKHKKEDVDLRYISITESSYPDLDRRFSQEQEDIRVHLDARRLRDLCDIAIAADQDNEFPMVALVINKPCEKITERWVTFYFRNNAGDIGRMLLSPILNRSEPLNFNPTQKVVYGSFMPEEFFFAS